MFKKILIVEDIDSINLGVTALLEKNFDVQVQNTKYCDDAYLKIKKALLEENPFDLIITDLSFKQDLKDVKLIGGEDLIFKIREEKIDIKVIVYSVEDQPYKMRSLFNEHQINAFVVKGREGNNALLEAIEELSKGSFYISPQYANILREQPVLELDKFDVEILELLSQGNTQEDISIVFKQKEYPSPSTSSIEKKINRLKFMFKVQNSIHLVATAKDMRII